MKTPAKFIRQIIAFRDDPMAGATREEMNLLYLVVKAVGDKPFDISFGSKRLNQIFAYLLWRKGDTRTMLLVGSSRVYRR